MELDQVLFRGRLRGHDVHVTIDQGDLRLSVDGRTIDGPATEPLEVPW
jgi:chaperone required for assembly of F1-ATPase